MELKKISEKTMKKFVNILSTMDTEEHIKVLKLLNIVFDEDNDFDEEWEELNFMILNSIKLGELRRVYATLDPDNSDDEA